VSLQGSGEDPVGCMSAGDVGVFQIADVVVPDQVEARSLFTLEEGVTFQVEGRVPVFVLADFPGGEGEPESYQLRAFLETSSRVSGHLPRGCPGGVRWVAGLRTWAIHRHRRWRWEPGILRRWWGSNRGEPEFPGRVSHDAKKTVQSCARCCGSHRGAPAFARGTVPRRRTRRASCR